MKSVISLRSFTLGSSLVAFLVATSSQAALVTGWTELIGRTPVSNMGTASPTLGNGTASSADAMQISASFGEITLANAGDKITLSGSATFTGIASASNQFRLGLLDVNGSVDANGWLGYFSTNGNDTTLGRLYERNNPNTGNYISTTSSTQIASAASPGGFFFSDGTYNFSLTLERTAAGGLQIDSSLLRTSDSSQFALSSFLDTVPQSYDFNRVGFLIGDTLDADQVQFSNIAVVPEPSVAFLGSLAMLTLFLRRRS